MANLTIKGHATRGKEVIELLEMLGGKNVGGYFGNEIELAYYIEVNKSFIDCKAISVIDHSKFYEITLEEFLEKFPYKVGDKVKCWINGYCSINVIEDIRWDSITNEIKYKILDNCHWYSTMNIQPYEEDTVEERENSVVVNIDNKQLKVHSLRFDKTQLVINDEYELKQEGDTYYIVRKQLKYPKTYEECCGVLGIDTQFCMKYLPHGTLSYKDTLIYNLQELLICRDAYWKIAGEQMGLGKPWKPDLIEMSHAIVCRDDGDFLLHRRTRAILSFPTEEMRDAFYENFKDLIESCKELL